MPPRQCVVLVGGLGTRLGTLTADIPKPLLQVGDRPFLAWLLRELCRWGFDRCLLLAGHGAARMREALPDLTAALPRPMRIETVEEPFRAGTGGALWHAREKLDDRFLLANGDSLIDANLAPVLTAPPALGRLVLRPLANASRYGVVRIDGARVTAFAERAAAGEPGLINAGLYLFGREIAGFLDPVCSLERDVLPRLAADGKLAASVVDGWFIDIGVPEDLVLAQSEVPTRLHRPALFLDHRAIAETGAGQDSGNGHHLRTRSAAAAVRKATAAGWHVFVVARPSDQEMAQARSTMDGWRERLRNAALDAGGLIDDVGLEGVSPLLDAWELDPARCRLIGTTDDEAATAQAAGVADYRLVNNDLEATVAELVANSATANI